MGDVARWLRGSPLMDKVWLMHAVAGDSPVWLSGKRTYLRVHMYLRVGSATNYIIMQLLLRMYLSGWL